ncbi:MAG: ABC transporter ATP-binding protein [Pseudomonadota bacterium]|nr:ABC transporter ATP-binding protein [Pseudomonadota bacterium]
MQVAAEKLSVNFGKKSILKGLSFRIPSGSFVALLGPNGSGKSTLLKAVAGFINFTGCLYVNSARSRGLTTEKKLFSYVPQNLSQPAGMTLCEYVMLGRTSHSNWFLGEREKDYAAVANALDALKLSSSSNQLVTTLSGGEMQRATLARALAQEATCLLLDEPTASMDFARVIEVINILDELRSRYKFTVVMATHDINSLSRYADFGLVLKDGSSLYSGKFSAIMNRDFLENLYDTKIECVKNKKGYPLFFATADNL